MFRSPRAFSALALFLVLSPAVAAAQTAGAPQASSSQDAVRFRLPTLTVTAQKEAEDPHKLPVSVTAVPKDTIDNAAIHVVSDAAIFAPNTYFTEFSGRKLSNPQFRGIGSSPANPGITTYIDGVPQFNANSSSLELIEGAGIVGDHTRDHLPKDPPLASDIESLAKNVSGWIRRNDSARTLAADGRPMGIRAWSGGGSSSGGEGVTPGRGASETTRRSSRSG